MQKIKIGFTVQVDPKEKTKIDAAAAAQERSVSNWCRMVLVDAARRVLQKPPPLDSDAHYGR
jgi:predicted HicB family RNase H-like nuclease